MQTLKQLHPHKQNQCYVCSVSASFVILLNNYSAMCALTFVLLECLGFTWNP